MNDQPNKILQLFDPVYVRAFFEEHILPNYPDFADIKNIEIEPAKRLIWHTTYHVVFRFDTTFSRLDGTEEKLPIYCSAHSSEPRQNVHEALEFLWTHEFGEGDLTIPRPLFYSDYFRGVFYRGVEGYNLYHYIKKKDRGVIEQILPRAAAWFAKLHELPTAEAKNFNPENSRIATVFPGVEHTLADVEQKFSHLAPLYRDLYSIFNEHEKKYFAGQPKLCLVHGDAHPENVIKVSEKKLAVIDFTDLCLADFARDLGTFLQQLEYMSNRKIGDGAYTEKIKKIFLDCYCQTRNLAIDAKLEERIKVYFNWTAVRSANFFLLKNPAQPERALELLNLARENLNL